LELSLFFSFWLITGLGLTVGYHRFFAHGAFATHPVVSNMLLIMGSMAGRGPMISWAAMHRRHHELSDHDGGLHSPNLHGTTPLGRLRGLLHAQAKQKAGRAARLCTISSCTRVLVRSVLARFVSRVRLRLEPNTGLEA
jgi:fatty-acid desaturase